MFITSFDTFTSQSQLSSMHIIHDMIVFSFIFFYGFIFLICSFLYLFLVFVLFHVSH